VLDPEQGWSTDRLEVEALSGNTATELFGVLDDPALHAFTGGEPLGLDALTQRYARLATRHSPDGSQIWANWLLRTRSDRRAVGTLQATLPAGGPNAGFAEVAWVVGSDWQGQGLASEAAASLVDRLFRDGWTVVAHIHPDHAASQGVARAAGLTPTVVVHDGEIRWARTPGTG
jgi:RimJ/RimL family protein N-acetyltransferase